MKKEVIKLKGYKLTQQHIFCDSFIQDSLLTAESDSVRIEKLTKHLTDCQKQLEESRKQIEVLSDTLELLTSSTSWKLTAPIRHILEHLRKHT